MKQITKSYLQGLVELGFGKRDIKAQILKDFGSEVTIGYLSLALKRFDIDLRKKPKRTDVVFVDDTEMQEDDTTGGGYKIQEGFTAATPGNPVDISDLITPQESAAPFMWQQ